MNNDENNFREDISSTGEARAQNLSQICRTATKGSDMGILKPIWMLLKQQEANY